MVALSLIPLGTRLAEFVLQAPVVMAAPSADALGEDVASRLEAGVADARRRCEEQGVDAVLLQGAATEVEILLAEVVADDDAVGALAREPGHFEEALRERARDRRRDVEAAVEPFFDALVGAVCGELARLVPESACPRRGDLTRPRIRFGSRPAEAPGFVVRREQARLFDAVFSEAAPRTVLAGTAGSGKSQLAAAVAARCEAEGWPLVAWISAESRGALVSGLSGLGRRLGVDGGRQHSPEDSARRCLEALASAERADRLIVLDNFDGPDDLTDLIPRGEGLRVLATTRRTDWDQTRLVHIRVGGFEREQSIGMLLDRTNQTDRETANAIAEALGDLPLAVSQAAATIKRGRYGLADYLKQLKKGSPKSRRHRPRGDHPAAIGVALRLDFQSALKRIGSWSPRQAMITRYNLGILALLAASGIPRRWMEGADEGSSDAREALNALIESSVCRLSEDGAKVMLHRLQIQAIHEDWENDPVQRRRTEREAVGLLNVADFFYIQKSQGEVRLREVLDLVDQLRAVAEQNYSKNLFANPRIGDAITAVLQCAMELGIPQTSLLLSGAVERLGDSLGSDHPEVVLRARTNLAHAYRDAERLAEAIDLFERVLADSTRGLGPDHPRTLAARDALAGVYRETDGLDRAIPLYERGLADRLRILGADNPDTLRSRNNLAYVYQTAGRLDQAIDLFTQNLAEHERLLGPDHALTLSSLKNLANACQEAGRLDEATSLFERVLTDSIRILGPDNPNTLISRNNLAGAYQALRRINKAIPLFQQNLTDSTRVLGSDHHDTVVFRNNLANAYAIAGKIDRAIPLFEQILNDNEQSLGPGHPHTLASRESLADAYREAGRLEAAIDLFAKNLTYHEQAFGPDNPNTLASRSNLAGTYKSAGKLDQAIELFERILVDRERILGADHPDTLTSRSNLAGAYQEAGRIDEAIPLFERVLTDFECSLGPANPLTLAARNNLAGAYLKSGKLDQALLLFKQVLTDREQSLGTMHPLTIISRGNLAGAYGDAGELGLAADMFEQTLVDSQRILGPNHPHTLTSRNNLASTCLAMGRFDRAIDLFEQNLAESQIVLGPDHPHAIASRGNLAAAHRDAGRLDEAIGLFERTLADCERVLGPSHPQTELFRNKLAAAYWAAERPEDAKTLLGPLPDIDGTGADPTGD